MVPSTRRRDATKSPHRPTHSSCVRLSLAGFLLGTPALIWPLLTLLQHTDLYPFGGHLRRRHCVGLRWQPARASGRDLVLPRPLLRRRGHADRSLRRPSLHRRTCLCRTRRRWRVMPCAHRASLSLSAFSADLVKLNLPCLPTVPVRVRTQEVARIHCFGLPVVHYDRPSDRCHRRRAHQGPPGRQLLADPRRHPGASPSRARHDHG